MKLVPIIKRQIEDIESLGYKPVSIQIHEELFSVFIEECKSFITTAEDKPAIDFNVTKFMGLPISKVSFSRTQFEQFEGFISPIQINIETYIKK